MELSGLPSGVGCYWEGWGSGDMMGRALTHLQNVETAGRPGAQGPLTMPDSPTGAQAGMGEGLTGSCGDSRHAPGLRRSGGWLPVSYRGCLGPESRPGNQPEAPRG